MPTPEFRVEVSGVEVGIEVTVKCNGRGVKGNKLRFKELKVEIKTVQRSLQWLYRRKSRHCAQFW